MQYKDRLFNIQTNKLYFFVFGKYSLIPNLMPTMLFTKLAQGQTYHFLVTFSFTL